MVTRRTLSSWSIFLGATAFIVSSCSSTSTEVIAPTTTPPTTPPVLTSADGVLRLGFLVPLNDEQAPFGPELEPLVRAALDLMNSLGGFGSRDIELVVRDEGTTPETARKAATELITTDRVDAIIGPFSSINAPSVIPIVVSAGIGVCSPTVSTQLLDVLDDNGLFYRTTAADSTIVKSMVDLAVQSGSERVSVAYPDDPYGRTLAREMQSFLDERDLEVVSTTPYQVSATDFRNDAAQMTSDGASLELIIGDPIDGPRFLNAVVSESRNSVIITNDALIGAEVTFNNDVAVDQRPRIVGLAPGANNGSDELFNVFRISDPNFDDEITSLPAFSVNTIDCLMLFWLAALTAESDDALLFKDEIQRVANDGSICLWIADCKFSVDEKLNIDYQGIVGLTLDETGRALDRPTILFQFNDDGRAQLVQGIPNVTLTS